LGDYYYPISLLIIDHLGVLNYLDSILEDHIHLEIYSFILDCPVYENKNFEVLSKDPMNFTGICYGILFLITNFINLDLLSLCFG
jgi:hypothetical protein